jgi:integrase/recombinase XerD
MFDTVPPFANKVITDISDLERFRSFTARKPFATVSLADLQDFNDSIAHLKPRSQCRMVAAVNSLLAFGHRIGILRFDVGRALRLPKVPNDLAARILDEESVLRMITLEAHKRNAALLRLL